MSEFVEFKKKVQKQFDLMLTKSYRLFKTAVTKDELWDTYLASYPEGTNNVYREKREYDCSACRSFIRPAGNVVVITENNELMSIWDASDIPAPYNEVAAELSKLVKAAPIANVFVAKEQNIGHDKDREMIGGEVHVWEHFYYKLPAELVDRSGRSIGDIQGTAITTKQVFHRSMSELTLAAAQTILELIDQGSLYRGEEHKTAIHAFIEWKTKYDAVPDEQKDNWCWKYSARNPVARIRNTALGTLLIDLSEKVELDLAVTKFEKVMAPANYKRPKAIFTKKMIEQAEATINEMGLGNSLARKHAELEDITVNNVLFVNRDAAKKIGGSVFDDLKDEVPEDIKNFDRVEEVPIETFVQDILPNTTNIELMLENRLKGNLMSLVAPVDREAASILKWDNNFSWSYNGDITDSMKQNVKAAGGNVEGILRFSIQWNENGENQNDFDAHCIEPNGNHIEFRNKGRKHPSSGMLDVDIVYPGNRVAVENITWTDFRKMPEGVYEFFVHNYSHKGGRSGFAAEIEYDGQIYSFQYGKELKQKERVQVAKVKFDKSKGISFVESMDSTVTSRELWGVNTNKFVNVSTMMFSPNYWDGQKGIGNKHYFFFLDGCKTDTPPRGFYNEFLNDKLMEHKRVFEALGSKMRVPPADSQLSGVGFSSTQRNSVVAKVEGSFSRVIKIVF